MAHNSRGQPNFIIRNPSTVTLPPTYETLMTASGSAEAPPPSYEEAMFLIGGDKLIVAEKSQTGSTPLPQAEE